ncbi:MAG: hypothetical protein ACTHOP_04185 [Mesorhizobium sp.]
MLAVTALAFGAQTLLYLTGRQSSLLDEVIASLSAPALFVAGVFLIFGLWPRIATSQRLISGGHDLPFTDKIPIPQFSEDIRRCFEWLSIIRDDSQIVALRAKSKNLES